MKLSTSKASLHLALAYIAAIGLQAPVAADQLGFYRELKNATWQYTIKFSDSHQRRHQALFQLDQKDVDQASSTLKDIDSLQKSIVAASLESKNTLEQRLQHYSEELLDDVIQRTRRHADELMLALPSGSRIHITVEEGGVYKFTGHLARDFRFWKYNEYNDIMAQSVSDLQVYFQMQLSERDRATEIMRNDLQRELQHRVDELGDIIMGQGLIVKNEYETLNIDYREATRRSLWHLRDLSYSLDSIGDDRLRVDKVLGFFQSIPYEAISDNRHESSSLGFRMPAVTIDQNLGDCDSKAVGVAAVLKNLMPHRRVLLVLIPGHALLAMQFSPLPGDALIQYRGSQWVLLEPVGPRLAKVGEIGELSREGLLAGQGISYVEL